MLVTEVTGLFDWGSRTHQEPWSTLLTHIAWKVACAATEAIRETKTAREESILESRQGQAGLGQPWLVGPVFYTVSVIARKRRLFLQFLSDATGVICLGRMSSSPDTSGEMVSKLTVVQGRIDTARGRQNPPSLLRAISILVPILYKLCCQQECLLRKRTFSANQPLDCKESYF